LPNEKDDYSWQILQAIANGDRITQRAVSKNLGVALGLTNLLIRRLGAKGYVRVTGIGTRHVRYLMTPAGWQALGRATRASLENTVHLYTQTREQIRAGLSQFSATHQPNDAGEKPVIFYGAGDVAEIAFVSLQTTDLKLVGVVDDRRTGQFFHLPIRPSDLLTTESLDGVRYDYVVVTSFRHSDAIAMRLAARAVPRARVSFL
jgi:DNA-binding MarR family transcriptional regulator